MPSTVSRVEMNGFAALDSTYGICFQAIKRSVAAPPPGSGTLLHFVRNEFAKNY